MAAPIIRSSGSTSGIVTGLGRNNLVIGETVTLTDTEAANAALTHLWTLSRPVGSAAVLTGAATATASFVPDITGSYLISCAVAGVTYPAADKIISVPLPVSGV